MKFKIINENVNITNDLSDEEKVTLYNSEIDHAKKMVDDQSTSKFLKKFYQERINDYSGRVKDVEKKLSKKEESLKEDYEDFTIYNKLLREIDNHAKILKDEYDEGEKSPSDILYELGYFESDDNPDLYAKGFVKGQDSYLMIFDFSDFGSFDNDFPISYYVLKNGKVPQGYTITKTQLNEGIIKKVAELKQAVKNKINDYKDERKDITAAK